MLELERQILNRNPLWREVLQQYIAVHEHSRKHDPEHDGWTGRQTELEELPPEEQAAIHGRLIALGLMRFQIADRTAGLKYQVTGLGRSVLQAALNAADDSTDTDDAVEADEAFEADDVETAETTAESAAASVESAEHAVEAEPETDGAGPTTTPALKLSAESTEPTEPTESVATDVDVEAPAGPSADGQQAPAAAQLATSELEPEAVSTPAPEAEVASAELEPASAEQEEEQPPAPKAETVPEAETVPAAETDTPAEAQLAEDPPSAAA